MKLLVANKFVLLKPLGEVKTESGIYIPEDQSKEKQVIGVIYKIGHGKEPFGEPMKPGDQVVFKKYMENTVTLPNGEKYNPVAFEDLTVLIKKKGKDE